MWQRAGTLLVQMCSALCICLENFLATLLKIISAGLLLCCFDKFFTDILLDLFYGHTCHTMRIFAKFSLAKVFTNFPKTCIFWGQILPLLVWISPVLSEQLFSLMFSSIS